jgi:hypothetical protein
MSDISIFTATANATNISLLSCTAYTIEYCRNETGSHVYQGSDNLQTKTLINLFVLCSLRVFEIRVLRIFGPKWDGVTGEWIKLHNEELRDLYSSQSIITIIKSRRMRWVGHVARMREKNNAYRLLVGKPEGNRPLGRPRHRWLDNMRMGLGEVGWGEVDWIGLAKDGNRWRAVVNSVLNFGVHEMLGNYQVA